MALTLPRARACPLWERAGMRESTEPPPPRYVARTPNADGGMRAPSPHFVVGQRVQKKKLRYCNPVSARAFTRAQKQTSAPGLRPTPFTKLFTTS